MAEAHPLDQLRDPGGIAAAVEGEREGDVLLDRQVRDEVEGLEDHADGAPPQRRQCGLVRGSDVDPGDAHAALVGTVDRGDQVERGRLAAAGGPDQGDHLGRCEREVEVRERVHHLVATAVAAADTHELDHRPDGSPRFHDPSQPANSPSGR